MVDDTPLKVEYSFNQCLTVGFSALKVYYLMGLAMNVDS